MNPMNPIICLKKKFVADIAAGDSIEEVFVLAEKNSALRRDGKPFLTVVLADKSGQIKGVVWDNVEMALCAAAGDFVQVHATANEYRGALQLVVRSLTAVPAASIIPADYLPVTTRDVELMFNRLRALSETITAPYLKALLGAFWNDAELVQQFKCAPAAKTMHHAYVGGLLEHTLSMALLVDKIGGHYSGVDRDMLLVGAVLHDIGKVRELSYTHRIDYTDEGRLLSHIVIGVEMVDAKIRTIEGFPQNLAAMVKHMIISHHGVREFGSPEPPKTIEAVLLNYIDEIDARVNAIREFIAAEQTGSPWTSYHRLLERHFYKGEAAKKSAAPDESNAQRGTRNAE
ncbi:MAG: HD domain-containing protein [Desulfobacteraceae bacterium]|nr:MAG: HD domain-containing protein [Desulfobacteraceae bacterium]